MKKVIDFLKESVEEIRSRVSWPKFSELQGSTVLVLVASIIFALIIGVIDYLFKNGMSFIYENF
ncbi:MAG: preprotein translocase subunit SecE [Sporocytophaga sp.]|jgi:preprotein translocase subunit SecE|uniref:preprotein translocase subunit SecE n=1 Tax=Sporocytophaga sp. TaxID=2231183 RepID=UPI001B0846BC|nr:preprotein translocase subunit SecE [Sporocytophaga sp.]MBO9700193.1 preprotein translocase subunit SecE [Sporocytophaga sp.]MCR6639400.1 preprotein translocase subunit SecE [Sporocytophaga sp.]